MKREPVEVVQIPQYQIMMNEYEGYTWFQNKIAMQRQSMKGVKEELITVYSVLT